MAKSIAIFEDIPSDGPKPVVRLGFHLDREDAPPDSEVTDGMLFALTVKRLFDEGTLSTLVGRYCVDELRARQARVNSREAMGAAETVAAENAPVADAVA